MPNLTSVTLTSGVPTAGTGVVSTLDNVIGSAGLPSSNVLTVQGNAVGTPIPVAGPIVVNAGTDLNTSALALDATLTGGTQRTGLVNSTGTIVASIRAASSPPQTTDTSLVVSINPNCIDFGSGTGGAHTQRMLLDTSQLGSLGAAPASTSAPVIPATDWAGSTVAVRQAAAYYVTVAQSQTGSVLQSSSGATGDYIDHIVVVPATTSPGVVTLLDNVTSITVFTGGTVSDIKTWDIPLRMVSRSGAWKITTGSNVSVIAVGKFS